MFWAGKLKQTEDTDSSWMLSYGDMVTFLLAMFVMIAAMSDPKSGHDRFRQLTGGIRRAFGFAPLQTAPASPGSRRPPTLLERFEQAGFARRSQVQLVGPDDEVLAPCELLIGRDQLTVRIAGHASFRRQSAVLVPAADRALRRVAEFLTDGNNRLEVRGHADDDPRPADTMFRDGMDLSYARARAVAAMLVERGVSPARLFVTAWAKDDPLVESSEGSGTSQSSREMPEGADRRIEIVVHAVAAAGHVKDIAGKDR